MYVATPIISHNALFKGEKYRGRDENSCFLPKMHSLFIIMIYNDWLQQTLILSSWGGILVLALRFYG